MMQTLRRLAFTTALLSLVALPAQAQQGVNVTGKWEFTYNTEGGRGPRTQTFTFKQDGSTVTGSTVFSFGRRGGEEQARPPVEIKNGTIKGDSLTFSVELSFGGGGRTFTLNYAAKVSGDTMTGVQTTARGERPFTGKRVNK